MLGHTKLSTTLDTYIKEIEERSTQNQFLMSELVVQYILDL